MPKKRILWVEDSARFELASVLGPVFASHKYDLTLADNVTEAAEYLQHCEFDAVLVDIRLPPGTDAYWRDIYQNAGSDRTNAKLGLALLDWLLRKREIKKHIHNKGWLSRRKRASAPQQPPWHISPDHVGVFSVESPGEIGKDLQELGVDVQHEKRPGLPDTVLLDILGQLVQRGDE